MPARAPIFSTETLKFLRDLKKQNNREWFAAHKATYESAVKIPLSAFATELSEAVAEICPEYATPPGKSVQRIYRDVRFSADKTPYRIELGISFTHRGLGKKAGSGIYISVGADDVRIAGGLYQQDSPGLYAVRQHIEKNGPELRRLLAGKTLKGEFGALSGELLKRPPRGFLPDGPEMDLLQRKQWLLEASLPAESVYEPLFVTTVFERVRILLPFVRFFEKPLLHLAKPQLLGFVE